MSDDFKASAIVWMKHASTILTGCCLAAIIWVGKTTSNVDKKVANLELQAMYATQLDATQTDAIKEVQSSVSKHNTSIKLIQKDIERLLKDNKG